MAMIELIGTSESNLLEGTDEADTIIGLSGNDTINSGGGGDIVYGDFTSLNLLTGTQDATSFAQHSANDAWVANQDADGHASITQSIDTHIGETYNFSLDLASNPDVEVLGGTVEVLWNGALINSINTNTEIFSTHDVTLLGTGELGELMLRSTGGSDPITSENVTTVSSGIDAVSGGLGIDRLVVDYSAGIGTTIGTSTTSFTGAGVGTVTIMGNEFEHFTILAGSGVNTLNS